MPSSTSSSERPLRVILIAFLIAALLAVGWDLFWRSRGFTPSVVDDVNIWSILRRHADGDNRVTALAGSSRFLMGLNLKTLQARLPDKRVIQLSINGASPISILQDLADDENFRGSVICEVLPHMTYTEEVWGEVWGGGYKNLPWSQRFEAPLHVGFAEKSVLALPDVTLTNLAKELAKHRRLPQPSFIHFDGDRQGQLDFSHVDLAPVKEQVRAAYSAAGTPLVGAAFEHRIAEIRQLAEKIHARGGSVLFFRMISTTPIREIEAARFPDAAYWNVFCQQIGFPCLNYADVPGLGQFTCPEGTHLDKSDSPAFTAILGDEIVNRRLLP